MAPIQLPLAVGPSDQRLVRRRGGQIRNFVRIASLQGPVDNQPDTQAGEYKRERMGAGVESLTGNNAVEPVGDSSESTPHDIRVRPGVSQQNRFIVGSVEFMETERRKVRAGLHLRRYSY